MCFSYNSCTSKATRTCCDKSNTEDDYYSILDTIDCNVLVIFTLIGTSLALTALCVRLKCMKGSTEILVCQTLNVVSVVIEILLF